MPRDLSTSTRRGSTVGGKSVKDPSVEEVSFQAVIRSPSSCDVLIWVRSWLRFIVRLQLVKVIELMFSISRVLIGVKGERFGAEHLMDNSRLEVLYVPRSR